MINYPHDYKAIFVRITQNKSKRYLKLNRQKNKYVITIFNLMKNIFLIKNGNHCKQLIHSLQALVKL